MVLWLFLEPSATRRISRRSTFRRRSSSCRPNPVLRTTARDVRHLDEPGLQCYLKDVGLYAPKVAELAMDGTDLLAADLTSVDLDLSDSDAAFLRASLEWWDITSSCAENPKMYAAIGGGGRRASVEKGYY